MSDPPLTPLSRLDPAEAWEPWTPTPEDPWDLKWAGHLSRRAAFGATWPELQDALREGPEATITRLLSGGEGQTEFDQLMDELAPEQSTFYQFSGAQAANADGGLQAWWLYRIIHTPHPLRERMTLFWHNHFATSIAKVRQPALMKQQNLLIRRQALGKFRPFLLEMSRDPAMLVWLDSNSNVRGRPNENYARELMELFSLGVGHYTEADIREAARAFTGWHTDGRAFTFNRSQHDDGSKTVLGQTGPWDGADVVRIVLDQPAAARFLVRKLYRHFISEAEAPPDGLLEPLAEQLRASDYDLADLVRTMLGARLFFSAHAYRQRVKSPVEFVVGIFRGLEGQEPGAAPVPTLPRLLEGLGQTLFAPPNVKGWPGGEAWLSTGTLLARHNLAWRIVQGAQGPLGVKVNPLALLRRYAEARPGAGSIAFLLDLLLQPERDEVDDRLQSKLAQFLAQGDPQGMALDRRLRETTHAILVMPDYQLA